MNDLLQALCKHLKENPAAQGVLGGVAFTFLAVLVFWVFSWLIYALPWPGAN